MNASILLTGATGYIGGCLLRTLEEGGHPCEWARDNGFDSDRLVKTSQAAGGSDDTP
jgi:nucleoside-diphosphate-sugar epimerase